ncbi:S-adenosyl-L-methionine-dependent methyltransferase [Tilletiaria anomala UBC 951]|uniref:S-adenosyl-L-methionine-dependent methyltransferase n=1 Tax=Tilletiaria anomala (strain ATCC 24038 / CBS 436.72 / UBC 951) TaxID=1037660 RepID=A0A066WFW3_TILAU|nr:S-adenosyl-L-methionine-dependent methyltransferase [Tilletiaria anomala UBC 951]KDN51398.1 S-adenosyl-L-methionine-dependent methyltransferase [Tilletiaria anomala UBC 951]
MSVNGDFRLKSYWDGRYETEGPEGQFDWFKSYEQLKSIIHELIPFKSARVLMLGCGNSTMSADMAEDDYLNVINIDFSQVLINQMQSKHPHLEWHVMDVRELKENAELLGGAASYDAIIDKGTLDALMAETGGSIWDPSQEVRENVEREVEGVIHLLKPGGHFIYLTFGQPQFRLKYLQRPERWSFETREVGEEATFGYFLYIGTKLDEIHP